MAAEHAAVVLAAGLSRRLGRPKQLLRAGGISLLRRTVDIVLATAPVPIAVVLPANRPEIAAEIAGLPVVCLINGASEAGLSGSLRQAARFLAGHPGATLIVGIDQPRLDAGHLRALLAAGRAHGGDVVTGYGPAFGIPVLVGAPTLARAAGLVGDSGFKPLWRHAPQPPHRVEAAELAFDLDTPADLDAAIARGWIDR